MPGVQELLVIAVVALLVFGPDRLPEFARSAARTLARLRSEAQRNVSELRRMAAIDELERELTDAGRELTDAGFDLSGRRGARRGARDGPARRVDPPRRVDPALRVEPAPRPLDEPPPTDPDAT